ncbi:hypothetical protein [Treponema sp. OMZ 838]|uniref:InlB B-repeat-containing protein n=1 Tax=Treponema sp. OMZ 838 TaxID=1539298 RepID=UPI000689D5BA|nr:hypothetical protein [Treponema sp. OMZ 838]
MYLPKKIINTITVMLCTASAVLMFSTCKPSIGTPWYPRSAGSDKMPLYVGEITVADTHVEKSADAPNFNASAEYTVPVSGKLDSVNVAHIKVKLYSDAKLEKELTLDKDFTLELAGGSIPLVTNTPVPVLLRIKPTASQYGIIEKTIKITRQPKDTVYLGNLTVYGISATPPSADGSSYYTVTVPSEINKITKNEIGVSLFSDAQKKNEIDNNSVTITVTGGSVQLAAEVPIAVTVTITPPDLYDSVQTTVMVTREKVQEKPLSELVLVKELAVFGTPVVPDNNGTYTLSVANDTKRVTQRDITVSLVKNDEAQTPVVGRVRLLSGSSVPLAAGTEAYLAVEITVQEPSGQFIKIVKITREKKAADPSNPGDPSNPNDPDDGEDWGSGGESDEDNNDLPGTVPPSIPEFNENKPNSNPKDPEGRLKWVKKTFDPNEDPFTKYTADSNGFSATQFDSWVVYISDFNNDTNVPTYRFKPGVWTGTPESYDGPNFGSSLKTSKNVKFYRYRTRKDRWAQHGGFVPAHDPNDERFYFYRFTSLSGPAIGTQSLDNSMFAMDTYSKFIFYYSEPSYLKNLFGNKVPQNWMDYNAPASGEHQLFNEPFYMSDPIGYVNADGTVVLYSWVKQYIANDKYHAPKNGSFTQPAEPNEGKPGYSPYRKTQLPLQTKWVENPDYTAAAVTIKEQPKSQSVMQGARDWFVQVIPNATPSDENLSYQWYENASNSNTGGTPVSTGMGNTASAFYFPTGTEGVKYYYCKVTNTNPKNNKTAEVVSDAVKVEVKKGTAVIHFRHTPDKGGTLAAVIDGQPVQDGATVDRGSVITLTASPAAGFVVGSWVGAVQKDAGNPLVAEYTVTQNATIGVQFKSNSAPPAEKVKLYFFTGDSNGTLKAVARVENQDVELQNGTELDKGTIVTFTADPKPLYEVDSWTVGESSNKTITVTLKEKKTTVCVFFKLKQFKVTFAPEPVEGGSVTAFIDEKPHENNTEVEVGKNVTFKAKAEPGYYLDHWEGWDEASDKGEASEVQVQVKNPLSVTAVFKKLYPVTFASTDENKGTVTATVNGESIESGANVREGQTVTFKATPKNGAFIIDQWNDIDAQASDTEKTVVVDRVFNVTASFKHKPNMQLTVTPKIQNVDLQSWSTADGAHFSPKYLDGVHLAHNLSVSIQGGGNDKTEKWEYSFPYEKKSWANGNKGDYVQEVDLITVGKNKEKGSALVDIGYTSFPNLKVGFTNYLVKSNRHDYWRTEYVRYALGIGPDLYRKQCLDNNSVFALKYNEGEGEWTINKNAVHINQVDKDNDGITDDVPQLPRPNGYDGMDPNYKTISFKNVTITYDENFTLAGGEEKDFVITYKVDNHDGTRSKGTIKVIYTIGWK